MGSLAVETVTLRARNTAPDSDNKIHDDTVARRFGFAGGLVPGVTVYAYLVRLPAGRFGLEWVEHGSMRVRLRAPVYEGEELALQATGGGDRLELVALGPNGDQRATGDAERCLSTPPVDPAEWPAVKGPSPDTRPTASAMLFETTPVLGELRVRFHADRAHEFLELVGDDLPIWTTHRVAHPGWLMLFANYVLTQSVRLGPWIHVESDVAHYGLVHDGDEVSVRARPTRVWERGGHKFVLLDELFAVGERPVLHVQHTAIYEPKAAQG